MPRLARNELEGKQFIHVMVQGINKETIFLTEREKLEYIKLLNQYKNEYHITIIAYCVMNNHVHVLVHVKDIEDLTKYMHKINTSYGIYFNKNRRRVGYVYRDRFKTQVINDEKHLYNCIIYIHNNPVKANICQNANEYRYSSYKEFLHKENEDFMVKIFKDRNQYIQSNKAENLIDMSFIEDETDNERNIRSTIKKYLINNKTNRLEIKIEHHLLEPIAKQLKTIYQLSNIKIAKYLGVSKYKIDKIMKNQK